MLTHVPTVAIAAVGGWSLLVKTGLSLTSDAPTSNTRTKANEAT